MTTYNMVERGAVATHDGETPTNNLPVLLALLPLLVYGDDVVWPAALPPTGSKSDCGEYIFWSNGSNNTLIVQIPDGVRFIGDGRSTRLRCIPNPVTGQPCRFIGRTLKASEDDWIHGGITIERMSVANDCKATNNEDQHAIMFGSAGAGKFSGITIRDVRVEHALGGDGVCFSTGTSDVVCERVEIGRTARRALTVSGHGDPGDRRGFLFIDCTTNNSPIRTNGMTFEHEDADGVYEDVEILRCRFSGPVAMGRVDGAVVEDLSVMGSFVMGSPNNVEIDGLRVVFLVEPTDSGLAGSDAHRGLNLYGTGDNVTVRNADVCVFDPLNRIAGGKAHALVVATGVTGVTLDNVALEVDSGKLAASGTFTGTPSISYH